MKKRVLRIFFTCYTRRDARIVLLRLTEVFLVLLFCRKRAVGVCCAYLRTAVFVCCAFGGIFYIRPVHAEATTTTSTPPATSVAAADATMSCLQTPFVVPSLGVAIPGVSFSQPSAAPCQNGNCVTIPYIAQYIAGVVRYLVGVGLLAAALMIIYGGFKYVFSASMPEVQDGKERIGDALIGLILLLSMQAILSAVSSGASTLKPLTLACLNEMGLSESDVVPVALQGKPMAPGSTGKFPSRICASVDECKDYCQPPTGSGKKPPASTEGMVAPKDVQVVPQDIPGIDNASKSMLTPAAIEALKKAAAKAQSITDDGRGPYTISLINGYRPLSDQIGLACTVIKSGKGADVGRFYAWPGSSLHGVGVAIDLCIRDKDKKPVTECGVNTEGQWKANKRADVELLMRIMEAGGFVRLNNEIWHYEFHGTNPAPPARCNLNGSVGTCQMPTS